MKYCAAIILVIVTLASAEPPLNREYLARQQAEQTPYPAKGRPSGPAFNLPLRSQRQQLPPAPAASYGPPPQEYGPPAEEPTTTEIPTTTETVETTTVEQAENFRVAPTNQKLRNAQQTQQINPASLYVVVPQTQNLIYAAAPATSAKLVAEVQQPRLLPVQAVPAFARIQEVPQVAQYQVVAPYTAVSSAYTSVVNTPFSYSFVQSFQ